METLVDDPNSWPVLNELSVSDSKVFTHGRVSRFIFYQQPVEPEQKDSVSVKPKDSKKLSPVAEKPEKTEPEHKSDVDPDSANKKCISA